MAGLDPSQLLDKFGSGISDDGKIVELRFARKNGKVAYVQCEYGLLSSVVLGIEQAAVQAYELQKSNLKGTDPRLVNPVSTQTVDRMQGAYTRDGKPVISFALKSGMRLELAVPEDGIPELIEWLEALEEARRTEKPKAN
jgi:hypothetical protein